MSTKNNKEKEIKPKKQKVGFVKKLFSPQVHEDNLKFGKNLVEFLKGKTNENIVETFEEARARLNFTDEGMKNAYKRFFTQFYGIMVGFFLLIFGLVITVVKGEWVFIIPSIVVGFLFAIRALDNGLRCFHIRHQLIIGMKELIFKYPMEIIPPKLDKNYKLKDLKGGR